MTTIKLKSLRENLESYRQKIKAGESFIVIRRSEPIFKISPVDDEAWEEVIDFTKIKKGGVEINEVLKRL
ncbi:MAG: hypothetical protein AAB575_03350 [Patescibacteria group bacterium]